MADWDTAERAYSAELAARAGAGPPATLGEIWNANWHATALDTLTGSGQPLEDSFNHLVDAATARIGPLPAAARQAGLDWEGARGFEGKALVISKLAAGLPDDQRKEIEPLLDFRARAAETAVKLERDAADVNGRAYGLSGAAAGWLAGVSRQMVDPVNLALLPVGGGEGGLLISTARMAAIAGASQAVQEPVIQRNRGELGLESGVGQAAGDVANVMGGTAVLGLGLPLLFRGAAYVARKAFGRPEAAAAPVPSKAPEAEPLALPAPWHFPAYDETIVPPNFNAPKLLPPPAIAPGILEAGRDLVGRLEGERGMSLPVVDVHTFHLLAEEAGLRERDTMLANNAGPVPRDAQAAAELLARVGELEHQVANATGADRRALLERRDQLLADTTPEMLAHQAAPLEQRRILEAERASIAARLAAIGEEKAKKRAEQLGVTPFGAREPVRPAPTDVVYGNVAPGDLEAAALLADRDVVVGPHGAAVDAAAARAERGEPLPPRVIPGEAFPPPRSTTRIEPEAPAAPAAEKPAPARAKAERQAAAVKRGPAARAPETFSLFEFLAKRGGLAPHPDLEAILGGNPFVPGFGRLIRKTGMTLDRAREAAVEAGYLHDQGAIEGTVTESTINHLLDAIDTESRGQRVYRGGQELTARAGELEAAAEKNRVDIERAIVNELEQAGIRPNELDQVTLARAVEIMAREGETDPALAYERAVMETTEREAPHVRREEIDEIPGWDIADEKPAPGRGARAAAGGQAAPGEGARPRGEAHGGTREEGAGVGNPQLAADAERALEDAGGDFHVTIIDPQTGAARQVSARQALAEAQEEAAAANELAACIGGGALEEEL